MTSHFNVAFCINRLALVGLGVTISSLLRNCSDTSRLNLWFIGADLIQKDKSQILTLLERESFLGNSNFIDFKPDNLFGHLKSLHGDWTTYGRLIITDCLPNEQSALYLDADLVVELDVLQLFHFDFENKPLAAVYGSKLKHALDNKFLHNKLNISLEADYFNAGITFYNLDVWRKQGFKEKCFELANKYPSELTSHDQTILNALFNGKYKKLPHNFNKAWYAGAKPPQGDNAMILHFVGSPKPWDVGGSILHNGYKVWKHYLDATWANQYNKLKVRDILRAWKLKKSYALLIKTKILARAVRSN